MPRSPCRSLSWPIEPSAASHIWRAYCGKFRRILADDAIGEVVGSTAAFPSHGGETEITYWIRRDWWGRGVATVALAALVDEVKVRPIYGSALVDNIGPLRVLERTGFVQVGSDEGFGSPRPLDHRHRAGLAAGPNVRLAQAVTVRWTVHGTAGVGHGVGWCMQALSVTVPRSVRPWIAAV